MAITQAQAILNLMDTLDSFFASLRENIDNLSPISTIQKLNVLRCQNYGDDISVFDNGVIFGLQTCKIKQLGETWGLGYGPVGPTGSLLQTESMNDWVITRGNIFNGNKIINIEPLIGKSYAYKLNPYITAQMQNYLVPGVVVYSTTTNNFKTLLSGQATNSHPVNAIEKTGINKAEVIEKALDYKYFNSVFNTPVISTDIKICKFILDINDVDDYEINVLNDRGLYPFIYGQPYYSFMIFSGKIYNYINNALASGYDVNVVSDFLYYIVNAEIWGTGATPFYTYWTTGGRILPDNIKYYYNILFDPDIS